MEQVNLFSDIELNNCFGKDFCEAIKENIKEKIKIFGFTAKDLGLEAKKVIHTRKKPRPKYQDPASGKTWAGRGKIPVWMREYLANGVSKENLILKS